MIAQVNSITQQGAISADWTLTGSFIIIGFLLVAFAGFVSRQLIVTLSAIQDELKEHKKLHEEHDENHNDIKTRVILLEATAKTHAEKTADIIISKMRAASGGGSKKHSSFD